MKINNIVDILIIVFIFINLFNGWRKGMVLSIFNFGGLIVSFILAKKFYTQFGEKLLQNIAWFDNLKSSLVNQIDNSFVTDAEIVKGINNGTFLNKLNLPETLTTGFNQFLMDIDISKNTQLNSTLSEIIVNVIINLMSFLLLFVILIIAIKILGIMINMLFKLPLLKGINQLGGVIFGFIISNVFILIFMAILVLLNSMGMDFGIEKVISESVIGKFYYDNNFLFYLINYYL